MDVTLIFFLASGFGFCLGYLFGHRDLRHENILKSISNFKKDILEKFTSRQKLVILNSKDILPELEEEELL